MTEKSRLLRKTLRLFSSSDPGLLSPPDSALDSAALNPGGGLTTFEDSELNPGGGLTTFDDSELKPGGGLTTFLPPGGWKPGGGATGALKTSPFGWLSDLAGFLNEG